MYRCRGPLPPHPLIIITPRTSPLIIHIRRSKTSAGYQESRQLPKTPPHKKKKKTCPSGRRVQKKGPLALPLPVVLQLRPRHLHQQVLVPDGHPRREHLHRVLKVRVQDDLRQRVDDRHARRVQHLQPRRRPVQLGLRLRVAQQQEHVPDPELRGERHREVE